MATSDGLVQQRRLQADGRPQCVPFYPYEYDRRASDLGLLDVSARPVEGASVDDLDAAERSRLRRAIETYGGDRSLLALTDDELDGALGFATRVEGRLVPTVAGLLVLGRDHALARHLPGHEVAFQVLDGTEVRINDFLRLPLLNVFERVLDQFNARIEERELLVGMFRVAVPSYDRAAFREALANAVVHRDYTRLGAIHVQWQPEAIEISNPGGFVDGVRLDNLLVTPPRPRNPLLADAFKRIGLVERTGRGVDIIYRGMLRNGRPAPDYSRSNTSSVVVRLLGGEADLAFIELVIEEQNRTQTAPSVDSLLALRALRDTPPVDPTTLARLIQKDERTARMVLEGLVATGLAEARGPARNRSFHLSAAIYRKLGMSSAYVRLHEFEPLQQEQMVLQYVTKHGRITRRDAAELCRINSVQARHLLTRLAVAGRLVRAGTGRGIYYERGR